MEISIPDVIKVALAVYKDKATEEMIEDFKESYRIIREAEGNCRIAKSNSMLKHQIQLEIYYQNLQDRYHILKDAGGASSVLEDELNRIKHEIRIISQKRENSFFSL